MRRAERMGKGGERLGSLKTEDSRQKGWATTDPTEATRRRVKVAREGCREERVAKNPSSTKKWKRQMMAKW